MKPLAPTITGYSGSIEETRPLVVTCTTTDSRPRAALQWTIGQNDVTSDATERSSRITASDTYTVTSDLTYSVEKSHNGKVLACKAVNVASSSGLYTSIALNVTCKFKKYVFILLHKKMSIILIELKEYKCTQKIVTYDLEQSESDEFPVLNLFMSTLNEFRVWIENPIWASTQKKDMTRSVGNVSFMMKVFYETTEPFKCKLAWNHRIFFLWSSAKYIYFFLHRSNIKMSEWVIF